MELSRQVLIDRIQSKVTTIEDFNYDKLTAPPLAMLLSQQDIDNLYYIATSVKYSGKPDKKYEAINNIMKARGFVKASAGTNRVVYRHLESNDFVVKVAADATGIKDNPREFQNQFIFKPFVTKVFEVSPCGTVGVFERVNPIESREEFLSVASDIYEVITEWFIGKYIMADIGTKFFMNWGIRTYSVGREGSVSFGPVLLDFPYVYELDGNKLFCSAVDHNNLETGVCGGIIDYDDGFNFLVCSKCGVRYRVKELAKKIKNNEIKVNRRRETKTMVIGRYDSNGNIVVDDKVVTKPEAKKVSIPNRPAPVGSLSIDMNKLINRQHETAPVVKEEKSKNNNNLRTNPVNRGIVKAPVESNIKVVNLGNKEPEVTVDENKEFDVLKEYNAEDDIIVLSNGDKEITAKLSKIVPEDYLQTAIESSAEYTEMLSVLSKNKELEAELEQVKINADKNFEEFADEKEKFNQIIEEKDAEIAEKDNQISLLEKEVSTVNKGIETIKEADANLDNKIDDKVNKLEAEIADKDKLIKALNESIAEITDHNKDLTKRLSAALANKGGIPLKENPEIPDINLDDYCSKEEEAVLIQGAVEDVNGFASPANPNRRKVVVFPIDPANGEYTCDPDGKIIFLTHINGYPIDDLLEKVEESEEKSEE